MRKFFDSIVAPVDRGSTDSLYLLFCAAGIVTVIVFVIAIGASVGGVQAGQFGDFFGGTLNPFLTFLTFMGLIVTIVLQQQELSDTRKELKRSAEALENQAAGLDRQLAALNRQNFEATFFQMLSLHNSIVNSMDIHLKNARTIHGRDCFKHFYLELKGYYERHGNDVESKRISVAHEQFWQNFQQDLAHYYRYLYNIVRFIDESEVNKVRYIRILRAQMSNYELAVMFYNGLSDQATKFKDYIEKYALFDNLPKRLLFSFDHAEMYKAFAYDEDQASLELAVAVERLMPTTKHAGEIVQTQENTNSTIVGK